MISRCSGRGPGRVPRTTSRARPVDGYGDCLDDFANARDSAFGVTPRKVVENAFEIGWLPLALSHVMWTAHPNVVSVRRKTLFANGRR